MHAQRSAEDSGHYGALRLKNGSSVRCLSALDAGVADTQALHKSQLCKKFLNFVLFIRRVSGIRHGPGGIYVSG